MIENEGFFLSCDENDTECENGVTSQRGQLSKIFQFTMMLQGPLLLILSLVQVKAKLQLRSFLNNFS